MGNVKGWSTGSIGNPYPDHSDRGNPNTKGLTDDGSLGVEGYIEEDIVDASVDNRPLKNLVYNDITIENNLIDVASEVDYGVFEGKLNEFEVNVLPADSYPNPELPSETIQITPLRINSGSAIIDGQVTQVGRQRISYFIKDDNTYLFPPYEEFEGEFVIEIVDQDYTGKYTPVWSRVPEGLPENFTDYQIEITNTYTNGDPDRQIIFDAYRDWEDIIPFQYHNEDVVDEYLEFGYDTNFGQFSEGYWLTSGGTQGTAVDKVTVRKDIRVKDELLNNFSLVSGKYEQEIITKGIFFDDISWDRTSTAIDSTSDLIDLYVHNNGDIYFINEGNPSTLYMLTDGAYLLKVKSLNTSIATGLRQIDNLLFIIGENGSVEVFDLNNNFEDYTTNVIDWFDNQTIFEQIRDVYVWDGKLWVAGDKTLWHTDYESFDIFTSVFTEVNIENALSVISGEAVIDHINKIIQVRGNNLIDSSLKTDIDNIILNPSFESGGVGNLPEHWNLESLGGSNATFTVQPTGLYGSFKATLSITLTEIEGVAWQEIEQNFTVGNVKTLSVYLNSVSSNAGEIRIIELDDSDAELSRSDQAFTFAGGEGWTRFFVSHTISSNNAVKLRVEISTTSTNILQIDGVQLEEGSTPNQFVEMFDYLFIGYTKESTNAIDPPFALLDVEDRYNPKFYRANYGHITSVNDAIYCGLNQVDFIDDLNIYTTTFLNNVDEYDRVTIKNISKDYEDLDFRNRVEKLETIIHFNDRTFIGGTIKNEVLKFVSTNTDDININIQNAESGESLITLLGQHSLIRTDGTLEARREFLFTNKLYETNTGSTTLGRYKPGELYTISIQINEGNWYDFQVTAPAENEGPWTVQQIANELDPVVSTTLPLTSITESSFILSEGLYSLGKRDSTKHIRGNIHKIVSRPDNNENLYMIRGNQIYRSKPDPNVLKTGSTYNSHEWDLYDSDFRLVEYVNKYNTELSFNDNAYNRDWRTIPVDSGYSIVPGSVRLKTNANTEVGFSEGVDFIVDYENNRIIRHDGDNLLSNSNFWTGNTGSQPIDWLVYYDDVDGGTFERYDSSETFTKYSSQIYLEGNSTVGIAYQIYQPSVLNTGDTYTASVYVKSYTDMSPTIRITECDATNENNLTGGYDSHQLVFSIDNTMYGQWMRIDISHTITDINSDRLRFELETNSSSQLWMAFAQLERNPIPTPYIDDEVRSRIDPDMHVWIDYTEERELQSTVDYTFDNVNRKVVLETTPTDDKSYYFSYKYNRIFNPHIFGDSLPQFRVTPDSRDDYFLYQPEGRIWAINQFLAMLSLDEQDELTISYSYHYPRVDLIKLRNRPDDYGNYVYIVKGQQDDNNPYKPYDLGTEDESHVFNVSQYDVEDKENNEILYSINVTTNDFNKNDIYDRRIWVEKETNLYNISLSSETIAYFPFSRSFNATNGMSPINYLESSKIVPIIKNFTIYQNEEVGAYHDGYQFVLRDKLSFPGATTSISVDPLNGSDTTGTGTITKPYKTIEKALSVSSYTDQNNRKNDIIIEDNVLLTEDVEVNKHFPVYIWARSYFTWRGALQNKSPVYIQGAYFIDSEVYPLSDIWFYYCTFDDSTVNVMITCNVEFSNVEFKNCHNSPIRVNDSLFPSPFIHPYQKHPDPSRDDGIAHPSDPDVATSDGESIAPGDSFESLATQPSGTFTLFRCLIHDTTDHIVHYDPEPDWPASFIFDKCTIAHNKNLFVTDKFNLDIVYADCILYENGETRGSELKWFDSNSDINLQKNFVDFSIQSSGVTDSDFNFGTGLINGRDTCIGGVGEDPLFVGPDNGFYDYHLRSTARGFSADSPALNEASDFSDLGCWDEVRQRTDVDIPRNIFTYIAFINEGIRYPIVLNSEKITFTVEFKPTEGLSTPGIMFDSRVHQDETDYIVLAYNNNDPDDPSLEQNPSNDPTNPYRFRLIVGNRDRQYVIVSPMLIQSDADFQQWHRLSWTVNYEQTFNPKSTFDEKDKLQNIFSFFHNEYLSVESYVKYDMNRDDYGELIESVRNQDETNDWNFNNISEIVTIGAAYNDEQIMPGYYSEMRIDNRFADRKILDAWNRKKVPFNDPFTQVNENPLVKSFDQRSLNEFWSLKSRFNVGAKTNKFLPGSSWRYTTEDAELTWVLSSPTTNLLNNSGFVGLQTAVVTADDVIDLTSGSYTFSADIEIDTDGSRNSDDNNGIILTLNGTTVNDRAQVESALDNAFANLVTSTNISYRFTSDGLLEFFTNDGNATQINFSASSQPDADALGFTSSTTKSGAKFLGSSNPIVVEGTASPKLIEDYTYYTTNSQNHSKLSPNSLVMSRQDLSGDTTLVMYHQGVSYSNTSHVYSAYVYYDEGELSNDLLKFYYDIGSPQKENWTRIERISGDWWLLSKTISFSTSGSMDVGIAFADPINDPDHSQIGTIVVDAVQFEDNRAYESPYVENTNTNKDRLIVNKNLLNEEKGTLFFRIKPRFNFFDERERTLFEITGQEFDSGSGDPLGTSDPDKSFKILYYFSTEKNRGVFSFRINDPLGQGNMTWDVETVERFFYQWHSIAISYDFENQRFVYFFDYFRETVDSATNRFAFFTDAWFGLDTQESEDGADVAIKDIIITNQPVSDIDILTWVNTYEFYKESLILNTLDEYNDQMIGLIGQITGLSGSTINIFNRLDTVESDILDLQSDIITINNNITTINGSLSIYDGRITDNENDISNLQSSVANLQSDDSYMQDGNTSNWNQTLASTQQYNIYENREDINDLFSQVATEVSARLLADQTIRSDFASNSPTYGASLVGVQGTTPPSPLDAQFTQTTVEGVLRELAGSGRTLENIKTNADQISSISTTLSGVAQQLNDMQDGDTGSWNQSLAQSSGYNIYENRQDINTNTNDISQLQTDLSQEVIDRTNADQAIRDDLSSTALLKGASLIGINDIGSVFTATEVEAALQEVKLLADSNTAMMPQITQNANDISTLQSDVSDMMGVGWNATMNLADHNAALSGIQATIITQGNDIAQNSSDISQLQSDLAQEVIDRSSADTGIINNLASTASGFGASLVGIEDSNNIFTSNNVEGALNELYDLTVGGLNWLSPVALWTDLPTTGNTLGDTLIVENAIDDPNETSAVKAQYICVSTSGSRSDQWTKVQNIDAQDSASIGYDNSSSGLMAVNVQEAIDELEARSVEPGKYEASVSSGSWTGTGGNYYTDITHELGTQDVVVLAMDPSTGEIIGVDEVERIDNDTVRIYQTADIDLEFTIFGVVNSYSTVVNQWTPSGTYYYSDISHNFNTKKLMVSVFDTNTGERIGVDKLEFTDNNILRATVDDNSLELNVFVLKSASVTKSKDLSNWQLAGTEYSSTVEVDTGYDAVYHFFDTTNSKSIEVNNVTLSGNTLTITKSNNNPVRMIILK